MNITRLCVSAIMFIVGMTMNATNFSPYCQYLMGTTEAQKALLTIETDGSGNIIMSIAPYNGDNNTAFRGSGYSDDRVKAFTVNGNSNTNYRYFTRSINAQKTQITFTPVAGMMNEGDVIIFNQIIEYKTSKDTNLWPTFTFTYTYGATCAGIPKVTPSPETVNFTPTQGVKTFALTGQNLTGNLTLTASRGLSVSPTSITPEVDGTIASANQTVTVNWEAGRTMGGNINISGGGLVSPKIVTVTSTGFSEFCNTVISQENNGTSNMAYVTVTTSTDKTQVILAIDPYDSNLGATAKWKSLGTIKVNNVTQTPTITYNNNTTKTVAILTFANVLSNGDIVTFGGALVWELSGTLWNNTNCYINASKTYTVGYGCSVAQADEELPVIVSASKVSNSSYDAVFSVNATDNIGVTYIHFEDDANGIDVTQLAKSDNGTANYTISNLQGNTTYSFVVTALDLAGNETTIENAKTITFTTLHIPQITANPSSLDFTPTTGSKTFTLSGVYVTDPIQLNAPTGYTIVPSSLVPTTGAIAPTTVTVNWINGLGNKIIVGGGGLEKPISLADLTYSGGFSEYCSYIITQGGGVSLITPALVNIGLNSDKTILTYKIAPFDIIGDATWNDNSLAASVILLNGISVNPTRTKVNNHTISFTFNQPLSDGDIISYGLGTTLVWTTTDYTNYANNANCFIDNWNKTYTVGQSCNVTSFNLTTNTNISDLSCVNCDVTVNNGALLNIDDSKTFNNISILPGAKLTLGSGRTLTTNSITLESNSTGTATLLDEGGTLTATTATVQQYFASARNWYMSSPVAGATVPTGQTYFSYDESGSNTGFTGSATAYWVAVPEGTEINPMKGYIAQPGAAITKSFTGTLNTGVKTVALTRTNSATKPGFNLVANPYPSYLDWQLVDTTAAHIHSSVWYRTKTSGGSYTFDTYNGKLNVATGNGENTVTKLIPPMQAFWVRVKNGFTSGTLTFDNSMRKHVDNVGNKFKAPAASDTKVVRLKVSNGTNSDEALLCFNADASNNFDAYDSPKMFNNLPLLPEIYTLAGNEKVVINGMNDVQNEVEIPIGFTTSTATDFTLKSTEMQNFDAGTKIILIDKLNPGIETDLTDGAAYNFSAQATAPTTDRFSLKFRIPGASTDMKNPAKPTVQVFVNVANQISIVASEKCNYAIYNAVGQKMLDGTAVSKKTVINNLFEAGVYIVKVSENGKELTTRIIIK